MLRKAFVILIVMGILCVSGCKKDSSSSNAEGETVKTMEQYKAEAEKEITQENLSAELDKLEKDVDTELSQEP